MKSIVCVVLALLISHQPVMAGNKSDAEKLLKNRLESVIAVLEKKNTPKEVKKEKIIKIVEPIFDFTLMAKLALGRKHLPKLTQDELAQYTRLFSRRLKESYLEKMLLYTDEKIVYEKPIQVKKKVHVPTLLVTQNDKITMLYKLYQKKKNWMIYDIEIEDVSIISTYRSQFSEILRNGTPRDLILELEKSEKKK